MQLHQGWNGVDNSISQVSITPEVVSRGVNRAVMKVACSLYMMAARVCSLLVPYLLVRKNLLSSWVKRTKNFPQGENVNSRLPSNMLLELINTTYNNFYLEDIVMQHNYTRNNRIGYCTWGKTIE